MDFANNVLIPEMKRVIWKMSTTCPTAHVIELCQPTISSRKTGFISHMDTADFNAENIQPQVIENYDGGDYA